MSDSDLAIRVAQRFVMGAFVSDKLEKPPPVQEQRDTNQILFQVQAGVGRVLEALGETQEVEREALLNLQRTLLSYGTSAPTLRVEQEVQFHMLVALKHLEPLDLPSIIEDTQTLDLLLDETR